MNSHDSHPGETPVHALMSRELRTVSPTTPLREALSLLQQHRVRDLPIVDAHGQVVAIFSERDLLGVGVLARAFEVSEQQVDAWLDAPVSELAKTRFRPDALVTVGPDTPASEAAQRMRNDSLSAVPVVDEDGLLVGVLTFMDILKTLSGELEGELRTATQLIEATRLTQ